MFLVTLSSVDVTHCSWLMHEWVWSTGGIIVKG